MISDRGSVSDSLIWDKLNFLSDFAERKHKTFGNMKKSKSKCKERVKKHRWEWGILLPKGRRWPFTITISFFRKSTFFFGALRAFRAQRDFFILIIIIHSRAGFLTNFQVRFLKRARIRDAPQTARSKSARARMGPLRLSMMLFTDWAGLIWRVRRDASTTLFRLLLTHDRACSIYPKVTWRFESRIDSNVSLRWCHRWWKFSLKI